MTTDRELALRRAALDRQQELSQAAKALGEWMERAADYPDGVPKDVWRRIADAAAQVLAAAKLLAADQDD